MNEGNRVEVMWYDRFTNEYVLQKDQIAPPERYIMTSRGCSDSEYQEQWEDDAGQCLDVIYPREDYESYRVLLLFNERCEEHHFKAQRLRRFVLPCDLFDKYASGIVKD